MTDNRDQGDGHAGGSNSGQATVIFDSSALLFVVLDGMGLRQCSGFEVTKVRGFMEGKNLAVVGTVLTEITNVVLAKCNTGTLGKDYQLKSPIEIIRMVNDVLPKGYEKIDVRRMDYEKHLKAMISMMDRIVEMPDSKTARRWLRLKRTMLRDKCARKEGEKGDVWTRRKLRYLRREAKRNDAKMLAKAMWLSDKRKVYFVSNDGDHLIFDEWAENRTGGRIEICRPSVLP